jgi:hypothetical protein
VTTARASAGVVEEAAPERRSVGLLGFLLPSATMVALLGVTLIVLLTPAWVHTAMDLAGGGIPGVAPSAARAVSDATVADLLLGGDFSVTLPDGSPAYTPDEASHLRDVRVVLYVFLALAVAATILVVATLTQRQRDYRSWRAVALGGAALVGMLAVLGVVAAVAFGLAFEVFHRLLFPGGNWAFPADSNLIRLYPIAFWQLSVAALGLLAGGAGALTWWIGRRRAASLRHR